MGGPSGQMVQLIDSGNNIMPNGPGACTPASTFKVCTVADAAGALALAASSIPYRQATVLAMTRGADPGDGTVPTDNAGIIRIHAGSVANNTSYSFALSPGASMQLPDFCDLSDFLLVVDSANDGVLILYTT